MVRVEEDAAGPDQAAAETAAAKRGGHVQIIAPQPAAEGGGGQKADIAGQGADIADMVGQPFQFQGNGAQLRARGGASMPARASSSWL